MALQSVTLQLFLDLIAEMPDIEAIEEIDTRLQRVVDERKALGDAKGQHDFRLELNEEEDQLRLRRSKLTFRAEQRKWSKAVRAVFGQEGFDRCMEWIRTFPEDDIPAAPLRRSNVRAK